MSKLSKNLDSIVEALTEGNYRLAKNHLNATLKNKTKVSFGDEAFNSSNVMRFVIYEFNEHKDSLGFECNQVRGLVPDTDPNVFELTKTR